MAIIFRGKKEKDRERNIASSIFFLSLFQMSSSSSFSSSSSSSSSPVTGIKRHGDDHDHNDNEEYSPVRKTRVRLWAACLPLQTLAHMASFLDYSGAVNVASASRSLKKLIDRDYVVTKETRISTVFCTKTKQRRPGVVGKFVNLLIDYLENDFLKEPNFLEGFWKHAKTITVSYNYRPPLTGLKLMEGLRELNLLAIYSPPIEGLLKLPQSLTHLTFEPGYVQQPISSIILPPGLEHLKLGGNFDQAVDSLILPPGLVYLNLGHQFCKAVDKLVLPRGLQKLEFGQSFDRPVDRLVLPAGLKSLIFGFDFNQPVDHLVLPSGLEELRFDYRFDQPVDGLVLPPGLKSLYFGDCFDQPVDGLVLPANLKVIQFGWRFDQPVDRLILPDGLESLSFGYHFDQPIDDLKLPQSLQFLELGNFFTPSLRTVQWPPNLKRVKLPRVDYPIGLPPNVQISHHY